MSSRSTFGTIKRIGAILLAIAVVLAAGILVGQAPTLFGVEENPEASITFADQQGDGTSVTIDSVSLSDGGFVVITDGGSEPIAVSDYLSSGSHENVTVERDEAANRELTGQLTATVHQDTDGDETYTYAESEGEEDRPYLEDGFPVSDTATVTTAEEQGLTNSFAVESIDVPSSATTNGTIDVNATISNPTEFTTQQNVEVRLDGAVVERQLLELEAEESRDVTFQVDASEAAPGERTIGVYTDADGALETIEFEFHTDPAITVANTSENESTVTFNVATPADGFVAVEDRADGNASDGDNASVVGTSAALTPGEHENVSVALGGVGSDDELTAVLYEGDPADNESAPPIEHDGEPVETTFTLADGEIEPAGDGGNGAANESGNETTADGNESANDGTVSVEPADG
ncbi:DUF7282 domain-containing protein [Halopiger xanaduensis]|uniref:DUF7282 domain-containing protein n=1 Tax=Halopiger xanaduensis (strain DSM 18323 / JCM 14033 / SH-6) TaxID=797210 RepID=F8DBA5_HALXS|nr:hypothetical protein [Halopiger xanaduensis]AEH35881.1 hypothetical protein Halxa_1248 [Halopiger xanaduensis SH-6]